MDPRYLTVLGKVSQKPDLPAFATSTSIALNHQIWLHVYCNDQRLLERSLYVHEPTSIVTILDGYFLDGKPAQESYPAVLVDEYLKNGRQLTRVLAGIYNFFLIDGNARSIQIYSDTSGSFPCYYYSTEEALIITNSLHLLRQSFSLETNPQGFAERFSLCWTVGDKTVFKDVEQIRPGYSYRFSLTSFSKTEAKRLAKTWTGVDDRGEKELVSVIGSSWQQAIRRCTESRTAPIGLMLSGGLDSRMVLGEMVEQGIKPVCCTHGDAESTEFEIARRIADQTGVRHIENPMDSSFQFCDLALEQVFYNTDIIFNPIWQRSTRMLHEQGVQSIATGCLGDVLLGGSYTYDQILQQRTIRNLALSLGFVPKMDKGSIDEAIAEIAKSIHGQAKKRIRNYSFLLQGDFQGYCLEALSHLEREVECVLQDYIAEASLTGAQLKERFLCEHRDRKYVFGQERAIRAFCDVLVPMLDKDYLEVVTNVNQNIKYDHHLYYKVFRTRYGELARIRVPNLYGSIVWPQWWIETNRISRLVIQKYRKSDVLSGWPNFGRWICEGKRLDQYKDLFMCYANIFDLEAVETYFRRVQMGEHSLYDGNETLNYLSLAMLVTPSPVLPFNALN